MRALSPAVLLVLLLAAAAAAMAWFAVYQVDDAFIVYRYAENLARGEGFVFNPGERVEGVTCFLWTLALVPFALAGLPLPAVAPVLTALCGLAVLALLPALAARADGRERAGGADLLPSLLLAAHPSFAYWSVGALETVPYTLLLVLAVRALHGPPGRAERTAGGWLGLASMVRPEAPLVAAALAAGRPGWRRALRLAVPAAAILGAFLLFRRAYFGDWLPNTYYAKTGGGLPHQAGIGWNYTLSFLDTLVPLRGLVPPATTLGVLVLSLALVVRGLLSPATRAAASVAAAITAAVFLEGGDWMVLHRFYVPALPFLMVLGVQAGRDGLRALPRRARAPLAAAAVLLLLAGWAAWGREERDGGQGLAVNAAGYDHAHRALARLLREESRPGDTVALMDVGIVGHASGLRVFDISGLVNRPVARSPGGFLDKRFPPELLLAEAPRWVVLVPGFAIDTRIALHPGFQARYRPRGTWNHRFNWVPPGEYELHLFERADPAPASSPPR